MVGGAALFGVGALCYYGLGLSNEVGAIDRAMVWPQVVRDRVRSTYTYFAGSLAVTAGTAYAISQSRAIYTLMRASPWLVSLHLLTIRFMCSVVVRIQWNIDITKCHGTRERGLLCRGFNNNNNISYLNTVGFKATL